MSAGGSIQVKRSDVPRLVSLPGEQVREYRIFDSSIVIGSGAEADFVVDEPTVSRRHARIRKHRGRYLLSDLGSTNGTLINGKPIRGEIALARADDIQLGTVHFTFLPPELPIAKLRRENQLRLALQGLLVVLAIAGAIWYALFRPVSKTEMPNAKPTPERGNTWIARLNYYRLLAQLKPVREEESLSRGDADHAHYLVVNNAEMIKRGRIDASIHEEDPNKPLFTAEGKAAGELSDVDAVYNDPPEDPDPPWAIENWITGPFHRIWLLNPDLRRVGYGQFCDNGVCAAALNIRSGIESPAAPALSAVSITAPPPVMFPSDGVTIYDGTFTADETEWPDPLSPCPGYAAPTGLPISLQLGLDRPAVLDDASLTRNGTPVKACAFDASSYRTSDKVAQRRAQKELAHFGAIVMVPREPLVRGATYTVSIKASGRTYSWWFAVQP